MLFMPTLSVLVELGGYLFHNPLCGLFQVQFLGGTSPAGMGLFAHFVLCKSNPHPLITKCFREPSVANYPPLCVTIPTLIGNLPALFRRRSLRAKKGGHANVMS